MGTIGSLVVSACGRGESVLLRSFSFSSFSFFLFVGLRDVGLIFEVIVCPREVNDTITEFRPSLGELGACSGVELPLRH